MGAAWGAVCSANTGLVCSFRTWLSALGPAVVIHSNKAWPNVPGWELQGQGWFVRAAMLWAEDLPVLFIPAAGNQLRGSHHRDKLNLLGLIIL